ncbi:MAG: hypothetical protein JPMHGGIA_01708 [Saprospiraceae bacterium]|nr:hypothetical protein [Saprospiraceae bacterium]
MKTVELLKNNLKFYLVIKSIHYELDLENDGTGGCPDCKAVTAGIKRISKDPRVIGVFRDTFASPHRLTEFGHQLKNKVYDFENHRRSICDIAELFDGLERAYFIEGIVKHVQWVNQSDYWDTCHLQFEKKVRPELYKLVSSEYIFTNPDEPIKTFPEHLLSNEADQLAKLLKEEFKSDIGITIRYMLEALIRNEPQLLAIENRKRKAVYISLKNYWEKHIGSYQSIFDTKLWDTEGNPDYESTKLRVLKILEKLTN